MREEGLTFHVGVIKHQSVAARLFGFVESKIGGMDQLVGRDAIGREGCDTDTYCQAAER